MRFGFVDYDSLYGSKRTLVNAVEDLGERFVGDVTKTTQVWTSCPLLEEPAAARARGRSAKHRRLSAENDAAYRRVEALAAEHFERGHQRVNDRPGTQGELWTRVWVRPVWTWEPGPETPRKRLLIVRRDADDSSKYSLTNLPKGLPWSRYAWAQAQRFWIEHAFHEAKSHLGMGQYQVRLWRGWHHHMALVAMALLFSQKLRLGRPAAAPLLSVRDITELLDYYLPRRHRDEASVLANIRHRHRQRAADLQRRNLQRTGLP